MVAVNALANILPINGVTTGEVSNAHPNLFAPAGFTFVIWGVIYFLLAVYAVYQLVAYRKTRNPLKIELISKTGVIFVISCLANLSWIIAWHNDYIGASTILIFCLLLCLILINHLIKNVSFLSKGDKLFLRLPFSIYFGWITVASIANVTILLVDLNWNGWGLEEQTWAIFILIVGLVISLVTMVENRDLAYGLTVIWAYFGILAKHYSTTGFSGQYPMIIATVIGSLAILIIGALYLLVTRRKKNTPHYNSRF